MKFRIVVTILLVVITSVIVNYFIDEPKYKSAEEEAEAALEHNQPEKAEHLFNEIIKKDVYNIENHRKYINAHFEMPEKAGSRDDSAIIAFYSNLLYRNDSILADICNYSLGLIYIDLEHYSKSLSFFNNVKNKKLKFLNNSMGYAYLELDSLRKAEDYFKKEISFNGNEASAYYNLCLLYQSQNRFSEIGKILKSNASKYIPSGFKQSYYYKNYDLSNYFFSYLKSFTSKINIWGFIAALAILIVWVVFLVQLDIYEREKWYCVIFALLLGMFFTFFADVLYKFYSLFLHFNLNGGFYNDFLYCWFGIGLIEEIIKIIPFLILLRYFTMINESYDYILYASLTALGFSFIENLIYFQSNQLHIIHGRALSSSLAHMFFSSIISYGIFLNSFKLKKNKYFIFFLFLLLASFAHGFYDFWLINKDARSLSILTILLVLSSVFLWNYFVNNALNNSCFYDKEKKFFHKRLVTLLLVSLTSIFLLEYLFIAVKYGPAAGNNAFIQSTISGSYLLMFYATRLGHLNIKFGQWNAFNYPSIFNPQLNDESLDDALGLEFQIESFISNPMIFYFPNEGKIVRRINVSGEQDWYVFELKNNVQVNSCAYSFILLRTKDKRIRINKRQKYIVDGYFIDNAQAFEGATLQRCDLKYFGWFVIK